MVRPHESKRRNGNPVGATVPRAGDKEACVGRPVGGHQGGGSVPYGRARVDGDASGQGASQKEASEVPAKRKGQVERARSEGNRGHAWEPTLPVLVLRQVAPHATAGIIQPFSSEPAREQRLRSRPRNRKSRPIAEGKRRAKTYNG